MNQYSSTPSLTKLQTTMLLLLLLLPLSAVADDLCMVHSMCETNVAHGGACMKMHTGSESLVRPSMGSWISYGLGTENRNLPGFVTICPTSLHGGAPPGQLAPAR